MKTMLAAMKRHTGKRPIIYTDITFHKEVLEGEFNTYLY
jgi:lysozyme